ncbi:MAG: glycosyltransferase, partial [Bdellovibrionales bacterium]|nr:glycosyltransferase [Bdellovibrionales bacterium]
SGPNFSTTSKVQIWEKVKIFRTRTLVIAGFPQALPMPFEVANFLKAEKPDIIHYHYLSVMAFMVGRYATKNKIAELMTYHFDPDVLSGPIFMRPLRNPIRKWTKNFCDKMSLIICPSLFIIEELKKKKYLAPFIHITNPVPFDFNLLELAPVEKSAYFTVMYVGRLAVEKNISYLLKGFQELLRRRPDAILWLAGTGPLGDELRQKCEELGISKQVLFLGHLDRPDLVKHYKSCDVFVLPSLMETLSLVTIEAMSMGKPIIVTDKISCAKELVDLELQNGFIVKSEKPSDLGERLKELATNPQLLQKMGASALAYSKKFDLQDVISKMVASYQSVVKKYE